MIKNISLNKLENLKKKAHQLRIKTLDCFIKKGEAHLGGSFSMIESLIILFELIIKKNDKFILSKAHASYPLCIILRDRGLKPKLSTHLEIDEKNGIYCTTGSLGHGLPISTGMALSRKLQKKNGRIFVMISDGECQEGTTWESLLIASKHKLDNLIILIDYNKIQALDKLKDALPLENLQKKLSAFNMETINISDGNSFKHLIKAFKKIKKIKKPTAIILNTIKGKGIKEFENDPVWHARKLNGEEINIAKRRLKLL